jgi:plastocyanin
MKILLAVLFVFAATTILTAYSYFLNNVNASDSVVSVGGNGSSWDAYTPKNIEIKVGESVTWHNPMIVPEPHTVAFLKDPSYFPPPATPFSISNISELKSVVPVPNMEPLIVANESGAEAVVIDNARHYSPVSIDSTGNNVTYLDINANYTMTGTEKFVSSGWMWPEGLSPPGLAPIKSFTVTFAQPGTYDYICVVHPWMNGVVTVT